MLISESPESLKSIIERFNRKERYIVFQQITARGEVELTSAFRGELRSIGWRVPDCEVLVLIDYHLNWLYAALELHAGTWATSNDGEPRKLVNDVLPVLVRTPGKPDKERFALEDNQEDIDLLLVWEEGATTHLGLIEAKAHSAWSNAQMRSKAARLERVLGENGDRYGDDVVPHFALMSFVEPTKLETGGWPRWMSADEGGVPHLGLEPPQKSRYSVGRVGSNGEGSSAGDGYGIKVSTKGLED